MTLTENFSFDEFACRSGSNFSSEAVTNIMLLAEQLEVIRSEAGGKTIKINSGYRSPSHNKKIGGAKDSQHLRGTAADIVISGMKPSETADLIERLIDEGKILEGGVGRYSRFTHYDIRGKKARWSK
jgi:uncharacterized protein YcbK (DUF882 family)